MEVFDMKYDGLIDHLKILDDRMVLVNPRFNNKKNDEISVHERNVESTVKKEASPS